MIKSVLDSLRQHERDELMYAFENEFALVINLPNDKFIGVNVNVNGTLMITESNGVWSYGNKKTV